MREFDDFFSDVQWLRSGFCFEKCSDLIWKRYQIDTNFISGLINRGEMMFLIMKLFWKYVLSYVQFVYLFSFQSGLCACFFSMPLRPYDIMLCAVYIYLEVAFISLSKSITLDRHVTKRILILSPLKNGMSAYFFNGYFHQTVLIAFFICQLWKTWLRSEKLPSHWFFKSNNRKLD